MVRVDMSIARAQITKRQRRRRRAAARRLARARQLEAKELAAAEAARHARQKAIQRWTEEEERLAKLRQQKAEKACDEAKRYDKEEQDKRSVSFAGQVMVTEIPNKCSASLPKPVASPIGVAITEGAIAKEQQAELSDEAKMILQAVKASGGKILNMDEDWDENDDEESDPSVVPDLEDDPEDDFEELRIRALPRRTRAKTTKRGLPAPSVKRVRILNDSSSDASFPTDGKDEQTSAETGQQEKENSDDQTSSETKAAIGERERAQGQRSPPSGDATNRTQKEHPIKRKSLKRKKPELNGMNALNEEASTASGSKSLVTEDSALANGKISAANTENSESPPESRKKKKRKLTHESLSPPSKGPAAEKETSATASNPGRPWSKTSPRKSVPLPKSAVPPKSTSPPGSAPSNGDKRSKSGKKDSSNDNDDKEIDGLFQTLVQKRASQNAVQGTAAANGTMSKEESSPTSKGKKLDKRRSTSKSPQRYTEDGLRIVSYEEIAKDQPANLNGPCPFECSCCFV